LAELDYDNIPYITFFADRHSYLCRGVKYTSASTLIREYEWPFPQDYWLTYKGLAAIVPELMREVKLEKYFFINKKGNKQAIGSPKREFFHDCAARMSPDLIALVKQEKADLAWQWEMKNAIACHRGTKFHLKMELKDLAEGDGVLNPFTGKKQKIAARPNTKWSDNATIGDRLEDLEDGYYPELIIFYYEGEIGVCGQVDRAWIWTDKDDVRWYYSDDWKTNYEKRNQASRDTFKEPLTHLPTTKDNTYSLQASIYGYMMELAGYKVAGTQITYIKDYKLEGCEQRELPYLEAEVKLMFQKYFSDED
jgi:hypothetical protein